MCLAMPGKVMEIFGEGGARMGVVDFAGVRRTACLAYAPEVQLDDYVIVHVGFAISVVDRQEAARSYALLAEMADREGGLDLTEEIA